MSIINRRKFFKKAISKCLPILGALVATALPIKADTISNGCKDCASMCHNHCRATCRYACTTTCVTTCMGSCRDGCSYICHRLCHGSSYGSCESSAKGNDTIKFKWYVPIKLLPSFFFNFYLELTFLKWQCRIEHDKSSGHKNCYFVFGINELSRLIC